MNFDPEITDAEVKTLSATTVADTAPFRAMADTVVDAHLTDKNLPVASLRAITLYLTAHFAFLQEGQVKSEKIGASSTTFNMTTGLGLHATTFGQTALFFDSSGTLSTLNAQSASDEKTYQGSIEVI